MQLNLKFSGKKILGVSVLFIWSVFSSYSYAVTEQIIDGFMEDIIEANQREKIQRIRERLNKQPKEDDYYVEYIKVSTQSPELQQQRRPTRGMSMDTVKRQFGEPQQVFTAIGKPPITRWRYKDYTVYFEFDKVVHAVVDP